MAAPAGNLNAEKWTIDHTRDLLTKLEDLIDDEHVLYLGHALGRCHAYPELWCRLKKKWRYNDDIIHRMKVLEVMYEAKVVNGVMTGRYNVKAAQLVLNRYHRYEPTEAQRKQQEQEEKEEENEGGISDEMILEVEKETGPLDEDLRDEPDERRIVSRVYGMTRQQMNDAGYHIWNGYIYTPDQPGRIKNGEWVPEGF